jgi:GT2 family glycosyltransferase
MKRPKVSVIIPNWNGVEYLQYCLPSLEQQSYRDFEVIIIDNGSIDQSVRYIEQDFPKYQIIKLSQNIGFSPAVNLGITQAKGEYIALINNDTKLETDCLKYLVNVLDSQAQIGMVAAKMLQFYRPEYIDSAGDYVDAVGHANNIGLNQKDGPEFEVPKEVFLVTGGGSLLRKRLFDEVGLFDEDYFAYFEDVDLGLRAQMRGYKGWFEPKARIYHMHKATSNRIRPFAEYLQFRNMTMTIIKDFPSVHLWRDFNWLKIILVNLNTIRFLSGQGLFKQAIQAEWYIISQLIPLIRKRHQIQSQMTVSPDYIASNIRPRQLKPLKWLKGS